MISYKKLWDKKVESKMTWKEIKKDLGLSTQTITNINKNEYVTLRTLERFAEYFDCDIGDLVERKRETNNK